MSATFFRVGGKGTRYETLAEAIAAAGRLHRRTGIIAGITEHKRRPKRGA